MKVKLLIFRKLIIDKQGSSFIQCTTCLTWLCTEEYSSEPGAVFRNLVPKPAAYKQIPPLTS